MKKGRGGTPKWDGRSQTNISVKRVKLRHVETIYTAIICYMCDGRNMVLIRRSSTKGGIGLQGVLSLYAAGAQFQHSSLIYDDFSRATLNWSEKKWREMKANERTMKGNERKWKGNERKWKEMKRNERKWKEMKIKWKWKEMKGNERKMKGNERKWHLSRAQDLAEEHGFLGFT